MCTKHVKHAFECQGQDEGVQCMQNLLADFAVLHFNYRFAIWAKILVSLQHRLPIQHTSCIIPVIPRANVIGKLILSSRLPTQIFIIFQVCVCVLNDDRANATVTLVIHGAVQVGIYSIRHQFTHSIRTMNKHTHFKQKFL